MLSALTLAAAVAALNATFPYAPNAPRDTTSMQTFVKQLHAQWEHTQRTSETGGHAPMVGGPDGLPGFKCPKAGVRKIPKSVMDVTVDDFEVVAAMGDSITAGFGAGKCDQPSFRRGFGLFC
jgi:hypothetical protein